VSRTATEPSLRLSGVGLVRDGVVILDGIDWEVRPGERWIVLGANGSGKTSLIRIASLYLHPSRGRVDVLGRTLGRVDVRTHRENIGVVSSSFADLLRPTITALDIVMTARHAALEPWWHEYSDDDRARALALLERFGCGAMANRPFAALSSGERQRVQLARTLMTDPGLLLLDEPTAGLDLAGREDLVGRLAALAADPATPATVLVTHHVDEIPPGFGHLLLLRQGRILAAGPLENTLTAESLGECFDLDVVLERHHGRWTAFAR
jgi:iron complex transport system ATP-binding protein